MTKMPKGYARTVCQEHLKERESATEDNPIDIDDFERRKNCCADCDAKRVKAWGRPTERDIEARAQEIEGIKIHGRRKEYNDLLVELEKNAYARERRDLDMLDRRVWSQFKDCEEYGKPYWTDEDFKKLYDKFMGEL